MGRLANYVYMVFRPDGRPLYVGKGSGARWRRHDSRCRANPHYRAVFDQSGGNLPVIIIASGLSEAKAFALETVLTESIGLESEGGPLVNCGHGGRGGPVGIKHSEEWCAVRRLRAIELWKDADYRAVMLRPDRARGGNGEPRTEEFKAAVSKKLRGNKHTLGFRHSAESRELMSRQRRGLSKSPETKAKMSEAAKLGWLKRKARGHPLAGSRESI